MQNCLYYGGWGSLSRAAQLVGSAEPTANVCYLSSCPVDSIRTLKKRQKRQKQKEKHNSLQYTVQVADDAEAGI